MYVLNQHTSEQYLTQMHKTSAIIKEWLDANNVYLGGSPKQVQETVAAMAMDIKAQGRDIDALLADIQTKLLPGCISTASSHCLAHLHPPTLVIGQIAEMIIAATNQSMDSWNQSPAATYIETQLIAWLCQRCKFDSSEFASREFNKQTDEQTTYQSGGVFTSGGTQSNLMGLLLARNTFYAAKGVDVQRDGLIGQSRSVILCSDQAHFSIAKNAALLGLGQQSVQTVATDASGAMLIADLQHKIKEHGADNVMAIVATAGTTDLGAIDPLSAIASVCKQAKIWLHVDAAWGGALLLSKRYRDLIDGIDQADSLTLDFHKHFFLPISCGAFLLRDQRHFESIRQHSEYLNSSADDQDNIPNLVTYSLQTTRRFDALKLWLALDLLGTDAYGALIDSGLDTARKAAQLIKARPDFVLLHDPIISSVLFYFKPQGFSQDFDQNSNEDLKEATELTKLQLAQLNRQIAQDLLINNIANIATTELDEQLCLKLTILNPTTQISDIKAIIEEVASAGYARLKNYGDKLHAAI